MKIKIQHQLTFTYILVILLTITLTGSLSLHWLRNFLIKKTEDNLRAQAHSLSKMLSGYVWDEKELPQAAFFFTENFEARGQFIIEIYDNYRTLIASSQEENSSTIKEDAFSVLQGEKEVKWIEESQGKRTMHITVPISTLNKIIGMADVSTSLDEIENIFFMMIRILGIATVCSVIVVSIIGFLIARTVTKPLNRIKNIAVKISQGNFEQRSEPVKNPAELAELSVTINYMADQLKSFIEEITNEKNKINVILANVTDGLIAIDLEGNIIFLNLAAEKKLQVRNQEVTGKPLKNIWPEEKILSLADEVIKSNDMIRKEITMTQNPPEILHFILTPFKDEKEENPGIIIVFRDITELRLLEEVRSEFFSNVSHELRTPLTIIKGFCITLLDDPGEKEEWDHALNTIEQETDRLTRLVNEMLDLSRLRSKKTDFKMEKHDIKSLILQVVSQFKEQCRKYNVKINCLLPENIPSIKIDRDKMKQVFINLIDNAFKYTPAGGEVMLEAYPDGEKTLHIKILDTGPGIPEEELPHLFERYFRSEKNKSRVGTGLGLTIVKEIIEAHGGKILVRNRKPHGLEISITISYLQCKN